MPTFTALTTLTGKTPAEALGEAMERLSPEPAGVGVFEVEDGSGLWEVGGYFTEAPDEAGLALLAVTFEAKPFVVSELPETDWVAHVRRELAPVEAGRFFVYGSHDADKVPGNGMEGTVACLEAAGFDHADLKAAAPFDLIFANILKGPLVALSPDVAAHLRPGGYAILSGILNEQADEVIGVCAQNGINLVKRDEIGEWTTLLLQRKP